jgi:hypothetical protein
MSEPAKELYLQLLKRSLCCAIYDEPPVPVDVFWSKRGWLKQSLAPVLTSLFGLFGARLCFPVHYTEKDIAEGRIWPMQAHTMIGMRRLDNLAACLDQIVRDGVPGDLIETGVWRGGACIFMRGFLAAHDITDRTVFVADSFRGLPKPDETTYPADAGDTHHEHWFLAVSRQQVGENFRRYGLLDSQVVFLEGWFKDTLPKLTSSKLALIRLDGDMYESTMDGLRNLYPKLSAGGFCIIDDYYLENCRKAVTDYREELAITEPITDIDGVGSFWRKAAR